MKHLRTCLIFCLSFLTISVAFAQAPAAVPAASPMPYAPAPNPSQTASRSRTEKLTPAQEKYNAAINDFNKATGTFDKGLIEKNIAELQSVAQMPEYRNNSVVHNLIGYLFLTQNNAAEAVPELQQAVLLKSDDLDARNNLGNALRQSGRYDEAVTQYQYILAHPETVSPVPGVLDTNKVKINLATSLGQAGRLDDSLAQFAELAAANPDAATLQNYGYFLQKAGKTTEAADAIRKSAELNPKDAEAWLSAGELYIKTGRNDDAISALNKAIGADTDPKLDVGSQYDAHFALAEAWAAKGDTTQAATEFGAAADLQPQNSTPLYNKGVIQEQAGLKSDAETTYRTALGFDPDNLQIQTALGLLLADEGKSAASAALLSQAAPRLPQDARAAPVYARLGDMDAAQKNMTQADAAWQQALTLNPGDTDTRVALANLLLARRQYVSALEQFDLAAQSRPQDAVIQNGRGTAYQKLKQYPLALAAFQKALAFNPRSAQIQNNVGVVYEELGRRAQAILAYKKALALNPQLREARQNLSRFASR